MMRVTVGYLAMVLTCIGTIHATWFLYSVAMVARRNHLASITSAIFGGAGLALAWSFTQIIYSLRQAVNLDTMAQRFDEYYFSVRIALAVAVVLIMEPCRLYVTMTPARYYSGVVLVYTGWAALWLTPVL